MIKKILIFLTAFLLLPLSAYAITVGWTYNSATNNVTPYPNSNTTASTSLFSSSKFWDSGLTSGNCVQAGVGGILTTTGAACGTGSSASSTLLSDNNTFSGSNIFSSLITGSVSGNAGTATVLQTARTINGVSFNGSSNITINAASSTLLGDNNIFSGKNTFASATSSSFAITGLANSILSVNANGSVVATTSIGTNLLTGTLGIGNGGTNATSYTSGTLLAYNGTSFVSTSTIGNNQLANSSLTINGTPIALGGSATISAASSTILSDNDTFSGNVIFTNTITGSVTGNAGTVTNGVYTTTFNSLFDNRLSASSSISGITTLPNLSLPYSQITGAPTTAASSTLLSDNNTFSGNNIFSKALNLSATTGTTTIAAGQGFTIGSSQFVVQQGSGFVGIGTNAPTARLQVGGNAVIGSTLAGGTNVTLGSGAPSGTKSVSIFYDSTSNGGQIQSQFQGTSYTALELNPSGGNVGIGTTTPGNLLTVWGDGTALSLGTNSAANNAISFEGGRAVVGHSTTIFGSDSGFAYLSGGTGRGLGLEVNNSATPSLYINNSGNVGIGTTTPGSILSINGVGNFVNGATSTLYHGINLTAGCFSINGVCVGTTAASSTLLSDNNTFSGNNIFNGFLSTASSTITGNLTLATTTTGSLNGVITVSGWPYAQTGAGVQQAINVACNGTVGGTVFLPNATYTVTSSIIIPSKCTIEGASRDATILTGVINTPILETTSTGTSNNSYSDIAIRDLKVTNGGTAGTAQTVLFQNINGLTVTDARFEHNTTPLSGTPESLYILYSNNVKVDNNYLFNLSGDGIQLNAVTNFTVSNNTIASSTDDAIDIDDDFGQTASIPSLYGTVSANRINGETGGNAIRVEDSSDVTVSGNQISGDNTGGCIQVNNVNIPMTGIVVTGNQVDTCKSNGIEVSGNVTGTVISGNGITNATQNGFSDAEGGIQVNSASTTVTGNSIYNIAKSGSDGGGILIYRVNNVVVSDNFVASSTNGVEVWNGCGCATYTGIELDNNHFSNVTNNYDGAYTQAGVGIIGNAFNTAGTYLGFGISTSTPGSLLSLGTGSSFINLNNAATSTFAFGENILGGCYAINGTCISGGGSSYTFSNGLTNTAGNVTNDLNTGIAGGQSVVGGTNANDSLTLVSNNSGTPGNIYFGAAQQAWYNANQQFFQIESPGLGTAIATTSGIFMQNATPAALGAQQASPSIVLEGQGWATTPSNSQYADWQIANLPVQGAANPSTNLLFQSNVNTTAFTTRLTLTSGGILEAATGLGTINTTNGNFWSPATTVATRGILPQWAFGTSSTNALEYRTGFYGSAGTVLTANDNYASVIFGGTPVTLAASGVHNWLTGIAVKPTYVIGAGAAKIWNTATLYIDGASTSTVNGVNYDFYASSTAPSFFGGNLGIGTTTPGTLLSINNIANFAVSTSTLYSALSIATTSAVAFNIQDGYGTSVLKVGTASTTGPIFTVGATTSTATNLITLFSVDQYGHLMASSTPAKPTVSSCGTGTPVVTTGSSDTVGSVTTGTGAPTACTITYGSPLQFAAIPFVTDTSGTVTAIDVTSYSTTGFTMTFAAGLTSIKIGWFTIQGAASL